MSKKLTVTKLKMAYLANNKMEAGAELYNNLDIKRNVNKKIENRREPK